MYKYMYKSFKVQGKLQSQVWETLWLGCTYLSQPSLFLSLCGYSTKLLGLSCGPVPFHSSKPLVTLHIFLRWHPCSPSYLFVWLTPAYPCRGNQSFSAPRLSPGSWFFLLFSHSWVFSHRCDSAIVFMILDWNSWLFLFRPWTSHGRDSVLVSMVVLAPSTAPVKQQEC